MVTYVSIKQKKLGDAQKCGKTKKASHKNYTISIYMMIEYKYKD